MRPHRFRIPTSVVMTLVALALSAWVIPAFTRQWDDRQKARELQAGLVTQMSSVTGRALTDAVRVYRLRGSDRAVSDQWLLDGLQVEAQLRTYFPAKTAESWSAFRRSVNSFIELAGVEGTIVKQHGGNPIGGAPPTPDEQIVVGNVFAGIGLPRTAHTAGEVHGLLVGTAVTRETELLFILDDLLGQEQAFADDVIASDPRGYSTNRADLVRDLLP
jgi:hypothetical protein